MTPIRLTVNGKPVAAMVEPRTHLADFLREQLLHTGVQIGCEHGVCGACTLFIDGEPARSCITFAVACDCAEIRTIEGMADDPVMAALRQAFSREHALQCGYCTPGMLTTARDIVVRLPDADERRIRTELSGNLCRCTGYVGIVRAIRSVLEARRQDGAARLAPARRALGPVGSLRDQSAAAALRSSAPIAPITAPSAPPATVAAPGGAAVGAPQMEIALSFTVEHPRASLWRFFHDVELLAACLPGASLREPPRDGHIIGQVRVRLGPLSAAFAGEGDIVWDERNYWVVVRGAGRDSGGSSYVNGTVSFGLIETKAGAATQVDVAVGFSLAGPLAQFSRSGIVNDLASRLCAEFAENLEAAIARAGGEASIAAARAAPAAELRAGSLLLSVVWERLKRLVNRLLGRFR